MTKLLRRLSASVVLVPLVLAGCERDATTEPETRVNLVATAQAAGSFSTLLTALEAAGLTQAIATGGPYTVFAPTDAAFAALPEGTLEAVLADRALLTAILTYHVVEGRVTSAQAAQVSSAVTLNGAPVSIMANGGTVMIDNARVVQADVEASNGIIHVIDAVLLPQQ
jgi:uncharacterized surface protein with fasciclin (FAS1) repeats